MTDRFIFVEGPDDVAALNELGTRMFGARAGGAAHTPKGESSLISTSGIRLRVVSANTRSRLGEHLVKALRALPPQVQGDEARTEQMFVCFDPDEDTIEAFATTIERALNALDGPWSVAAAHPLAWTVRHASDEPITVALVPWATEPTPPIGGLHDVINLDRLLHDVLARAYPSEVARIGGWLDAIAQFRATQPKVRKPKWKATILLWAALVDDQATTERGLASRFLGQHDAMPKFFDTAVRPTLVATGLDRALAPLFA